MTWGAGLVSSDGPGSTGARTGCGPGRPALPGAAALPRGSAGSAAEHRGVRRPRRRGRGHRLRLRFGRCHAE